jgi:hypothetical protein
MGDQGVVGGDDWNPRLNEPIVEVWIDFHHGIVARGVGQRLSNRKKR